MNWSFSFSRLHSLIRHRRRGGSHFLNISMEISAPLCAFVNLFMIRKQMFLLIPFSRLIHSLRMEIIDVLRTGEKLQQDTMGQRQDQSL